MTETLIVLLIFFIIMFAGIYIYFTYTKSSIETSQEETTKIDTSVLLTTIKSMPEFSCSNKPCIDIIKLIAFQDLYQKNKIYYQQLFGKKKIEILNIYPETQQSECNKNIFNDISFPKNCNHYSLYNFQETENKKILSSPISLYNPIQDTNTIGKILITIYS